MEGGGWRPAGTGETVGAVDGGASADWRSQLQPEARQRIVNKIMETLKRHLPISVPEGINELKKIAVRFEEKIYTAATSQSDYLRKISLKMLSMETKTQTTAGINPSPSNVAVGNQNTADSASLGIQSQIVNQGQSLSMSMVNQSPVRQPLMAQNLQNNAASTSLQGSAGMQAALPSIPGLTQSTIASGGQPSNMQNMAGMSQNSINNPGGQGTAPNIYANAQRQMQGRQQQQTIISQQQQQQSQNSLMYHSQFQPQLLKQKMLHPSILQSHVHQQQQQQQSLLQPTQLQSSQQQPLMQMSSSMQSGQPTLQQTQPAISAPQSTIQQQSQQNSMQQSVPSLLQQHPQSIARQQHAQSAIHPQAASLQQQSTSIPQQSMLSQQQQQLMGQQSNMSSMQQNQLLGQQNNVPDIQQQQQQRLPGQQNNLLGMQQQQQMMNQQNLSLHQQQQLGTQSNISGLQQQQQQPLLGSQTNVPNLQTLRSMNILQQNKTAAQQQTQQPSMTMMQPQGQQSQHLPSQQQLMPQMQSQPSHLQQQITMQPQTNSLQREMQHRFQNSGALLQSQNAIEQQKQFIQTQRGLPEVSSSTSLDSTAQTGHAGGVDWQEEIYQKIKSMKELYLAELNEFNQKLTLKFQQHENVLPLAKQSEQYKKMESFKFMLERSIALLQLPKNNIQLGLREKLPLYEKQIVQFLSSNRSKKIAPQPQVQQQFQQPSGHALAMSQQQSSQVSQLQQQDNHVNQVQQSSGTSMQPAATNMQHGSVHVSQLVVPTTQQNMTNMMQSGPSFDQAQASSFGSLQQGTVHSGQHGGMGSLQNTINAPQQTNMNSFSQSSIGTLQANVGPMQQGPNALQQQQHLKQQQQQQEQQQQQQQQHQMLQNQQIKQQFQQRHMQQQLMQQQQKHPLLQQQPVLQQQLLQQKQQQTAQSPVHQMAQLNQMNEVSEMKLRQVPGMKSGPYQQHYPPGQRHNYFHPQLKAGSFPISSPQNLQASSPQISQHSSPQIDQHGLLSSHPKTGTPLQSANSPFVVPSPSTPVAPSPIPGDSEKQHSSISSLSNAVVVGHQQATVAPPQLQSLAVGTPGISASPLLAEFSSPDGNQANVPSAISSKSIVTERPLDRLIKAVQSISPKALNSSISDIGSVVSMIDRIAGSAPGNGSRAAVGEDLVAITKCRLQARNFMTQDGSATTKKMKRHTSAMPLNAVSSAGSVNDSFKKSYGLDTSELESTATSSMKRQKIEVNHALLEEIREINQQLIETVVSIIDEDVDSIAAAAGTGEGTVIKFLFSAVACSPSLKSQFASAQMSPIMPLKLLVPANYPKCSPILLDKLPVELSREFEDLSSKAKSRFSMSLRALSQPMSLGDMARTWDVCARKVIAEYAQQMGGGSFSSRYGAWENCVSA